VKKLLFIFLFQIIVVDSYSQLDTTIYGLTNVTGTFYFSKIDPISGIVTNISSSPISNSVNAISSAINPTKKYYYFESSNQFITVDISGNVVNNPTITFANGGQHFDSFFFDCSDSIIYGLTNDVTGGFYFSKMDPTTGIVTNISTTTIPNALVADGATLNAYKKLYYLISSDKIITIDITNGSVINSNVINFTNGGQGIHLIAYNCQDSTIYGLTNLSSGDLFLSRIDPSTGAVTNISSNALTNTAFSTRFSINPFKKQYYFEDNSHFITVNIPDGTVINNPNISISIGNSFDYFKYFNNCCCETPISINLGFDQNICPGDEVKLDPNINSATYLWQDNSTDSIYIVNASGIYWVEVLKGYCSVNDTIIFTADNCEVNIEMPNIFTPNNDGFNDLFLPLKAENIDLYELFIFNRWGKLIYKSSDIINGWDGKYKGKYCTDGVYFWIINYSDKKREYSINGTLTLIR
jgi:gliding motility-associated-like protein